MLRLDWPRSQAFGLYLDPGLVTLASESTFWPRLRDQNFGIGLSRILKHLTSFDITSGFTLMRFVDR